MQYNRQTPAVIKGERVYYHATYARLETGYKLNLMEGDEPNEIVPYMHDNYTVRALGVYAGGKSTGSNTSQPKEPTGKGGGQPLTNNYAEQQEARLQQERKDNNANTSRRFGLQYSTKPKKRVASQRTQRNAEEHFITDENV